MTSSIYRIIHYKNVWDSIDLCKLTIWTSFCILIDDLLVTIDVYRDISLRPQTGIVEMCTFIP